MELRATREALITALLLLTVLLALAGWAMAMDTTDRCPDGTPRTGFSCNIGTSFESPGQLP